MSGCFRPLASNERLDRLHLPTIAVFREADHFSRTRVFNGDAHREERPNRKRNEGEGHAALSSARKKSFGWIAPSVASMILRITSGVGTRPSVAYLRTASAETPMRSPK